MANPNPTPLARLGQHKFVQLLPDTLSQDPALAAAATALDGLTASLNRSVTNLLLWPRLLLTAGYPPPQITAPLQRLVKDCGGLTPLPTAILEALAWQFHVDFRPLAHNDRELARLICDSVAWHRIKGTPASVEIALAAFGFKAEVLEHAALDAAWTEAGGWRLDGTIPLDGSRTLSASTDGFWTMTQHWAEYALDLDISAAIFDPEAPKTICAIANATAPARSHLVALRFRAVFTCDCPIHIINPKTTILISLTGPRALHVPHFDTLRQLDPLSPDATEVTLTPAIHLDGSWTLGGTVATGQPLDAGIGIPSVTATVTPPKFGCGGNRATGYRLCGSRYDPHSQQMIPLVLDGSWGLGGETSPEPSGIWAKFIIRQETLQ